MDFYITLSKHSSTFLKLILRVSYLFIILKKLCNTASFGMDYPVPYGGCSIRMVE